MNHINKTGREEIASFLDAHHVSGHLFGEAEIAAWAAEAEEQMGEGNPPTIEIPARNSITGATETYTVSNAGVDLELCMEA